MFSLKYLAHAIELVLLRLNYYSLCQLELLLCQVIANTSVLFSNAASNKHEHSVQYLKLVFC